MLVYDLVSGVYRQLFGPGHGGEVAVGLFKGVDTGVTSTGNEFKQVSLIQVTSAG